MPGAALTAGRSDELAVREVYRAHFGMLSGWAGKLVGDFDLGHDVATEAFLRLLKHWGDVDEPKAWLYTTAANIIRDHWRKRGREHAAYPRHAGMPRGRLSGPARR